MPFDPTKPANNTDVSSQEIRDHLNGLKALIDAVPAGPQGPSFSNIQIGGVTTVDPETATAVSVSVFGNNVELSFSMPKGDPGGSGVSSTDVTNAIANEITGTARNPNTVSDLVLSPSDPRTQGQLQAVIDKVNELLAALRR